MTIREADIKKYGAKTIFILMPSGAAAGLGASFPEGSEDAVLRIAGDEILAEPDGVGFDAETGRLTLRTARDFNLYSSGKPE